MADTKVTDYFALPDKLPDKPTGWTQQMTMHLNMGSKGGHMGAYEIKDETGKVLPIRRQYNTKHKDLCGFTLPGVKPCMSWDELRRIWPIWIERARKKQRAQDQSQPTG